MNLYIIINMLDRSIGWETELFLGNLAELHPSCLVLFQFISLRSKICYFTCVTVQILICRIKYTHINFYAIDSIVDIALIAVVLPYLRSKNTVFFTNFQLISELHTLDLRSPTQQKLVSLLYAIMQCTFSTQPPNGLSAAQGNKKKTTKRESGDRWALGAGKIGE